MASPTRLAAVDLGSNSFRLEIGRVDHGHYYRSEYLKETVRQGGGLDEDHNLSPQAMQRGWDCLERFGERLQGFGDTEVRAVATQTLREARNRDQFLPRASQALGFPIDVISGREEARLIYQGVTQTMVPSNERRLVIDIGGRSTEMILGQGLTATQMGSWRVGSVAWSARFFPEGQFSKQAFKIAQVAAKAVFDEATTAYRAETWEQAYGSAGTLSAIADILEANGRPAGCVDQSGLDWLLGKLLNAKSADQLRLSGLKDDRRPLIGGGLSIALALFDLLNIEQMHSASGGLRHGLLFNMMGDRNELADVRCESVNRLALKFGADQAQSARVSQIADSLFGQLNGDTTDGDRHNERSCRTLTWAAQLHEIGNHISHNDYRRHGAYIVANADVTGFSLSELQRLSVLVLAHRGKLHKLDLDFGDTIFVWQLLALRLAVALCHARRDPDLQGLRLKPPEAGARTISLAWRPGWASVYPQSAHLLREESLIWQKTPWTLALEES